jgi:cell pole-organizing protein PopZ
MAAEKPTVNEVEDEQSMEEILQSIRRIIAEEDQQQKEPAESPKTAGSAEEEVLELTELYEAESLDNNDAGVDPLATIDALMADTKAAQQAAAQKPAAPTAFVPPEVQPTAANQAVDEFGEDGFAAEDEIAEQSPAAYAIEEDEIAAAPAEEYASLDALISNEVASAATNSIRAIREATSRSHVPPKTPSLSFRSGTTVEDLIVEAVRPMLKEWLDANLPQTVERIIAREIHRLVEQADEY